MHYPEQFNVIREYIEKVLSNTASAILNDKEKQRNIFASAKNKNFICEYIAILEKFEKIRILPIKYNVIFSKKFKESKLYQDHEKRIKKFITFLEEGNIAINFHSENFIPKSYKRFLNKGDSDEFSINLDVLNDFYGIRHAHIVDAKSDNLIFYSLDKNNAYLLNTGCHDDFFKSDNLEILVKEFPELIHKFKIMKLDGIHPGIQSSPKGIEFSWKNAGNEGYIIDNVRYSGMPMTFSKINNQIIDLIQNLFYQIETGLEDVSSELKKQKIDFMDKKIEILKETSDESRKTGCIYFKNDEHLFKAVIYIPYLQKVFLIEKLIEILDR